MSISSVHGGAVSSGPLVSGREKHAGCYREAPPALISEREGEMKRKTEGRGEIKKKEKEKWGESVTER